MSESFVEGKGESPLPMFAVDTLWEDWEPAFRTFLGIKSLEKQFDSANPSDVEPRWSPAAQTAAEFVTRLEESRACV